MPVADVYKQKLSIGTKSPRSIWVHQSMYSRELTKWQQYWNMAITFTHRRLCGALNVTFRYQSARIESKERIHYG